MQRQRSISPVGTSRFEKEYAPQSHHTAREKQISPTPSSPTYDPRRHAVHISNASKASTIDSMRSLDNNAYSTAPTSLNNSPIGGGEDIQALPRLPTLASTTSLSQHTLSPITTKRSNKLLRKNSPKSDRKDERKLEHTHHDSHETEREVNVVDTEEWFARFRSGDDYDPITDDCPDRATLAAAYNIPIYASDGTPMPFGQLYHPATATHTRQLIIFIRHFYCGACQAYLKAISDNITMQEYFSIPTPTSIVVIGCGHPELIPFYKLKTGCPFPIYAEPSRALFKRLGMILSLNIGMKRPEYMKDISPVAWAAGQMTTIRKGIKARQAELNKAKLEASERKRRQAELDNDVAQLEMMEEQQSAPSIVASSFGEDKLAIRKRDVVKGGNIFQIGGEFLFEEGEVVWCHRMRNYRNHAEVSVIRKVLELDD
jgi:hypothetical protein